MKKFFLFFSFSALLNSNLIAQQLMVLTDNGQLALMQDVASPATLSQNMAITGVPAGMMIAGIDYRPNTGELYGLAYNSAAGTNNAQLVVINTTTGMANAIGSPVSLNLGSGGIGFDFNPAVDRIRIVAENGMNYRLHPVTGALVATDGNLAYAVGDIHAGTTPHIVACGYTNSYIGSEATTLYNYDKGLDVLVSQVPPNNGTLNTIGTSGLAVNMANPTTGMDIYFNPVTKTNMAFINANVGTASNDNLYSVNLSSGQTSNLGNIGVAVRDIAAVINRTVPATFSGELVYGLTKVNSNLLTFSSDDPTTIRSLKAISGLVNNHRIAGMDVRPADLKLYALGYNDTSKNFAVYRIDTATGAATKIGEGGTIDLGMGERIGFDFNPTVDRIRVTATNAANYRLNPETGGLAATDTALAYVAGDAHAGTDPHVGAIAYINSYKNAPSTMLYGVDEVNNAFVSIAPPNQGALNTIMSSLLMFNSTDRSTGMDFYYDSVASVNKGYFAANSNTGLNDSLYTIDQSGNLDLIDAIGWGVQIREIAVQLQFTNYQPVNTKDIATQNIFTLYPNPVQDKLVIDFGTAAGQDRQVSIRDITGKVVAEQLIPKNSTVFTFELSALPQGVYILKSGLSAAKFMKL